MTLQILILVAIVGLVAVEIVKLRRDRRDPVEDKQDFMEDFVVRSADIKMPPEALATQAEAAWREIQKRKGAP